MTEKKEYIEREALINVFNAKAEMAIGTPKSVFHYVSGMLRMLPTADVVEIEVLKEWLYEIAINNVGVVLDGDFSNACEEIIARLDGLRAFVRERREQG